MNGDLTQLIHLETDSNPIRINLRCIQESNQKVVPSDWKLAVGRKADVVRKFYNSLKYQGGWDSPVAQLVKNPPTMQETWVQFLGWEDPLEKGKATHSRILAWRIPRTVWSIGSQKSDTTDRVSLSPKRTCRSFSLWSHCLCYPPGLRSQKTPATSDLVNYQPQGKIFCKWQH